MKELLYDAKTIQKRIVELGENITDFYKNESNELVVVGILRGSCMFYSDLIKCINLPIYIDFMAISSFTVHHLQAVCKNYKRYRRRHSG